MDEHDWLAEQFEVERSHLRAVAYRMLGSLCEADDAVQESWLHLSRSDTSGVENLGGWLTTVVARVCLDMLRSRNSQREESLGTYVPNPIVSPEGGIDPEQEVLLADSVGLALLVVLDTLNPAERLARRSLRRAARGARPRRRAPSRPRSRACGRNEGGPRCGSRCQAVLGACPVRTTGARERSRGSRVGPGRTAACCLRLHDHGREDRRNRPVRRPRAPSPA
jgi:DNA-directed RNA polymerase specialized sigma24 family protein